MDILGSESTLPTTFSPALAKKQPKMGRVSDIQNGGEMSNNSSSCLKTKQSVLTYFFCFALTLAGALSASGQIIYDNGGLATGATSNSGTAAPAGTQWSEAANPYGNTNEANTNAGISCSVTATVFRCADDFNVPVGQTWTINSVVVFAYQTGFAGGTSPITAATLRIWNGRPGDAGSTIVFGDTTTNRFGSSVDSSLFRIFSTVVGAGANPPTAAGTTRRIWQTTLNVSPAPVLTAGNYWIDWNTQIGATTAHFAPAITYQGIRGIPGFGARQFTGAAWVDAVDAGQFPTGQPVPPVVALDFPFKLNGSKAGTPAIPRSRVFDFNGDNRTDYAIARAASAGAQTTWWIRDSSGAVTATPFGLGVGITGGDTATPADFDGDGKTDIAVWRPGAPGAASFYILDSATSTFRGELFGQTGDDPTVAADFDGDGKADPAVYRGAAQSFFYYRGSLSNPGGAVTFVPWGTTGDLAIPGDYDGDGRADFCVARNSGGQITHYRSQTTAGFAAVPFGLNTDKFVTGDFDADGRADIVALRTNGAALNWYVLRSSTNSLSFQSFGTAATDFVTVGDYDGDGRSDAAVWRSGQVPGNTVFIVQNSAASPTSYIWGQSAGAGTAPDYPVASFRVK